MHKGFVLHGRSLTFGAAFFVGPIWSHLLLVLMLHITPAGNWTIPCCGCARSQFVGVSFIFALSSFVTGLSFQHSISSERVTKLSDLLWGSLALCLACAYHLS